MTLPIIKQKSPLTVIEKREKKRLLRNLRSATLTKRDLRRFKWDSGAKVLVYADTLAPVGFVPIDKAIKAHSRRTGVKNDGKA